MAPGVRYWRLRAILWLIVAGWGAAASGHPGGVNAEGCHNDRKNGGYHCHRSSATPSRPQPLSSSTRGAFPNCAAARAAGAAPVRAGDPGYGRHLDRDGDGIGCE
ncbi:excalibur calcium-binding domain-containing protein [Sphingobium yanoikuyae]|uniref:excalibur calcium-binding domain-containing protein n=1 Tax=Sphingobium yanoikuyae TaxID=13690 RepID=UPI002897427E|nr:excalibur calcium-binding domain-containing protein [Sphingobium yanoikuyae]